MVSVQIAIKMNIVVNALNMVNRWLIQEMKLVKMLKYLQI